MSLELQIVRPLDADVIVVGAGPGGAAAAARLARDGFDTLLLDRSAFPRDKVCGDFVGPVALLELAELGVTRRPDFQRTNRIRGAALFLDGEQLVTRAMPQIGSLPPFGRVIPRAELDEWIREAAIDAGARFLGKAQVTDVANVGELTEVTAKIAGEEVRLTARIVIGADGSNSTVARVLRQGKSVPKKDRIVAVRAYWTGVRGPGDRADLFFSENSFPGYYWLFPTSATTANVGLGMVMETTPPTDGHLRTLLLDLVERDPAMSERLGAGEMTGRVMGWPLSTFNHRTALVADGVILVGDAAGLINPLNGEGIQYALISGRWAAETVAAALRVGSVDARTLDPYHQRVVAELRPEMALATTIVSLIRRRDLNPVWLGALRIICARAAVDRQYAELAGGILAGVLPASSALSRPMFVGTAQQAAWTSAIRVGQTLLRPRQRIGAMATDVGGLVDSIVRNSAREPTTTAGWGFDVVRSLAELAMQTIGGASEPTGSVAVATAEPRRGVEPGTGGR